jgi:hypothetical protein
MTDPKSPTTPSQDEPELIEPTDEGAAALRPEPDEDPVTVRSTDPAAMSEHERNLRQQEQYGG